MQRIIKILLWADGWCVFALGMLGPIYAIFVQKIGGDILDASWAYFAFMISQGLALFYLGRIEDKTTHREWYVTGGYTLIAISSLMYLFVENQSMLVFTQIIAGLGGAVLSPAFDSLYGDSVDKNRKASEWGYWEGMGFVVTALGALLGGYVANLWGFETLFIAMFLASVVSVIISFRLWKKIK